MTPDAILVGKKLLPKLKADQRKALETFVDLNHGTQLTIGVSAAGKLVELYVIVRGPVVGGTLAPFTQLKKLSIAGPIATLDGVFDPAMKALQRVMVMNGSETLAIPAALLQLPRLTHLAIMRKVTWPAKVKALLPSLKALALERGGQVPAAVQAQLPAGSLF